MKDIMNGQRGQAFAITLIVVAVTGLLSIPVLSLTSSVLHRSTASRTTLDEQYSVDGGTEDAVWRVAHDPDFLAALLTGAPQNYTIVVNGEVVDITVQLHTPSNPPPTPLPTPTPQPGIDISLRTYIDPPVLNLSDPPAQPMRMTLFLSNLGAQQGGGSNATVHEIIVVLPKGFGYAGNLESDEYLVGKDGKFVLPEPAREWADPPDIPSHRYLTGRDPFQFCNPITRNDGIPSDGLSPEDLSSEWERLVWGEEGNHWKNNQERPRIDKPEIAKISFDIALDIDLNQPQLGFLADNPWWGIQPNTCNPPTTLEAGLPSGILVFFTFRVTATQGGTTLISDVLVGDTTRIIAQRYE